MKVLVIEQNEEIVSSIALCFKLGWLDVDIISSDEGATGVDIVERESPDLVILEPDLPDVEGLDVLTQIRGFSDVPLIILTSRDGELDKAKGLEMGADDYIIKPFSPVDLLSRIKAVLRRSHMPQLKNATGSFISDDLAIDFASRQVFVSGKPVKLTPTEYKLLCYLVRNEGRVITRNAILEKIWGADCTEDTGFVKKYIHRLRVKLNDDSRNPRMLLCERGVGYRFTRPL